MISQDFSDLKQDLERLLESLPTLAHNKFIYSALNLIVDLSKTNSDRADWELLSGILQDMHQALEMFDPHRLTQKVSIFGSARTTPDAPEYALAKQFAKLITDKGFMVLTGGGGGIMAAGNEGAGSDRSFGLNIDLPFEQVANDHVGDRIVNFKYFFTRKLFFLRESAAIALFPGGFGTQDELFESLTLLQTGKSSPMPLILIDNPGGDYWKEWDIYMQGHLLNRKLISAEDQNFYTITDSIEAACAEILNFYSIYHSSRWVQDQDIFMIRLNSDISDPHLKRLNQVFANLINGEITRGSTLKSEKAELVDLPTILVPLVEHSYGHLQQLIKEINKPE